MSDQVEPFPPPWWTPAMQAAAREYGRQLYRSDLGYGERVKLIFEAAGVPVPPEHSNDEVELDLASIAARNSAWSHATPGTPFRSFKVGWDARGEYEAAKPVALVDAVAKRATDLEAEVERLRAALRSVSVQLGSMGANDFTGLSLAKRTADAALAASTPTSEQRRV